MSTFIWVWMQLLNKLSQKIKTRIAAIRESAPIKPLNIGMTYQGDISHTAGTISALPPFSNGGIFDPDMFQTNTNNKPEEIL